MAIIAGKFAKHKSNFIWQPLLASSFIVLILAVLGGFGYVDLLGFIGTCTLGSSAFLVFTMPTSSSAEAKRTWGAYIISLLLGVLFSALVLFLQKNYSGFGGHLLAEISSVLAVTLTMFLMALLNFEHPPAAGLSLGLIVEPWTSFTIFAIVIVVALMLLVKYLLGRWLIDLVDP